MPSRKKPGGAGRILHIKFQPFAPPPNSHYKHHKEPPQIDANLAFDCDRRSCIWPLDPRCFGHPPRPATPPGGAAARARHASGRISRRAPSAATQERVADPEPPPKALAAAAARPLAAASTTAPTPWLRGRRAAFPRGTVGPPAAPWPTPAPRSPLTSLVCVPQACAAGCCCWLRLLLLLAPTTSGWGEPVAQPHHIRRLSSAHGARLGLRTFSGPERPVVGARPSPPPPPHLPSSPPNPPPTHVLGQPLRSR